MKNFLKYPLFLFLLSAIASCSVKNSDTKITTSNNSSNSSTASGTQASSGGTSSTSTPGDTASSICQEIVEGKCYRKVSNIQASGGAYGQMWWSSANYTASGSSLSPNLFSTDAVFNVRIIPRLPTANATSTFNRVCSSFMMYATKLKVQFMLHKQGVSVGEVGTVTAPLSSPSGIYKFVVPASSDPLVLEVVNVQSDSRCAPKSGSTTQSYYGTIPSSCSLNPYLDIPINTANATVPTECVSFDILYSTDETWSLQ